MATLEQLEEQFRSLDVRQTNLETYMKLYAQKTDEQLRQVREEQKAAEQRHREDMREMRERMDKVELKMDTLSQEVRGIGRFVQNMSIAVMVGVGAMTAGFLAALWAVVTAKAS